MKVLITGQEGYIGSVMVPALLAAGHELVGYDTGLFLEESESMQGEFPHIRKDIRDLGPQDLEGFAAVIHLAALSNDPLGALDPEITHEINHQATVRLARLARSAGVERFVFASSCSVYGAASPEKPATEDAPPRPYTAYAQSKVRAEEDLRALASDDFSPVFLRNATAYGWSPRFRADLVVNNLAGWAQTAGEVRILSDGTPWRPVVHVRDLADAFAAVLEAPREAIHSQAFNVGLDTENYQVRELAAMVQEVFPGCRVTYAEGGGPDPRSYRVDFGKIRRCVPAFRPAWDVRRGVEELRSAFEGAALTQEDLTGPRYVRIARLKSLLQGGQLGRDLRWLYQ